MTAEPPGGEREGAILAARWSIERLRRPGAPELVWLGYAKPDVVTFACVACGEAGFKQGVVRAAGRTMHLCPVCASHQVHPPTLPATPPVGFARRVLLESGFDAATAAAAAARVLGGEAQGCLLDLACGLGLVVDIVRTQPGWTACGVDAGPLPALGADVLGAPLAANDEAGVRASLEPDGATVVLCDGALERSAEPLALLRLVRDRLPDARWLMAAADAGALYASDDGAAIRELIGTRVFLPSRPGLQRLLMRAGFSDATIRAEHGMLHVDWPNDTARAPASDPGALLDAWLERRLGEPPQDEAAALGLRLAALERATERSDPAGLRRLLTVLRPALAAAGEAARSVEPASHEALFARAPTSAVRLLCAAGAAHLRDAGASTQALMCFELAAQLARHVQSLATAPQPETMERHWSARFQAALIARAMGDAARAETGLRAVATQAQHPAWAARAQTELDAPAPAAPEPRAKPARKPARVASR